MDLKEKRKQEGWKQQFIWLEPKSVEILENMKREEKKSYQEIINSLIQGQDRKGQEENIEEIIERIIEKKLENREIPKPQRQGQKGQVQNYQEIIEFIEKYRIENFTWEDIANKLNDMGFRTVTGKLWKRKSVNDFYKKWKQ